MNYFICTGFNHHGCQNRSVLVPSLAVDINVLNLYVISWKCASCQLLVNGILDVKNSPSFLERKFSFNALPTSVVCC